MTIKLIIFDFDGTLVDSKEEILNITKCEVEKEGLKLSSEYKRNMGDWPMKIHLKKEGIRKGRKVIMAEIEKDLVKCVGKLKRAKGLNDLGKIRKKKIILSNNSEKFIRAVLRNWKADYFEEVNGPKKFRNKVGGIRNILKRHKVLPKEAMYVGDRDRDVLSAQKAGCYSVAVSSEISWCSRKELVVAKPDFLINELGALKEIVKTLDML